MLLGSVPLSGNWATTQYLPAGGTLPGDGIFPSSQVNWVSEDYFRTMGIPLLQGRDFGTAERLGSDPVVIVNEEFARRA